jgi:hypothetical protein
MGVVDGLEIGTGFITHDARSVAQESLPYEDRQLCHLAVLRIDCAQNAAQTAPPRTNEQSPCRLA